MNEAIYQKNCQKLRELIDRANLVDITALSLVSGVSRWQISRLLHGLILNQSISTIVKLTAVLQMPIAEFIAIFAPEGTIEITNKLEGKLEEDRNSSQKEDKQALESLQIEYERLQKQLEGQRQALKLKFQQKSLETLEPWLIQWPTAATAAKKNTELPATKLLPLVKPIEKLIKQWGVETIDNVEDEIPYDPQYHELMEGEATAGETVKVRYVGYSHCDRLLHRVKVSPISPEDRENAIEDS